MPDEQTARLRRLVDWLSAGWADAATLAEEMFALPPAGWDDWLAKHSDARSVHFFETLLDAADRKGVALTTFVLRHLQSLEVPPEAKMALVFLRGRAWTVHARLLRSARDVAGALEAYESAAEVFRSEDATLPELLEAEREAAALRGLVLDDARVLVVDQLLADAVPPGQANGDGLSSVAIRLLRETPYSEWPRLAERAELRNIAALTELRRQAEARLNRVPLESLTLAQIATTIADGLPDDFYPPFVLAEIRAQAWKDRGMALGYLARYAEALAALDHAEEILQPFPALAYIKAHVQLVRSTTLRTAARFEEAFAALNACTPVFERSGDRRRLLLCRNAEGALLHAMGRFREARDAWLDLVDLAAEINDREMLAGIHNNASHSMIELGDFTSAEKHVEIAIALFTEIGQDLHVARSRMALGRMLIRKGEIDRGIAELRSVRERFLTSNLVEEAGLCGLDIVEAHLLLGASIEAEALARQILREFTAAHLNARAFTALQYLSEAIGTRKASPATVEQVRAFILALRTKPESEFAATA